MIGSHHEMDLETLKDTTDSQSVVNIILTKETILIASIERESCVSSFGSYT